MAACDGDREASYVARRLLRHEITPRYETLYTGGDPGPPEANDVRGVDDSAPCADADGAEVAAPWSSCMKTAFDGLNERIACVVTTWKLCSISYYRLQLAARAFAVFSTDP